MRKLLVGGALCVAMVVGTGSAAFAGERGGSGKQTPVRDTANSFCAFSGLEDHDFVGPVEPGVVQNWGQIVSGAGGHLGGAADVGGEDGCNARLYPAK